jgi:hypothetical protein
MPLANINEWIRISTLKSLFFFIARGYRMIAAILQARGFRNFSEIEGGLITKLQYQPPILSAKVKHFNLSLLY